jgi:PPM family protein phosphatase
MLEIDACVLTHRGNVRANNEDSVSIVRPRDAAHGPHSLLAIVADGMGGHEGGELASKVAVETIQRTWINSTLAPNAALEAAFVEANRAIYHAALMDPKLKGMGTTCVAVVLCDDHASWAWIGDSRLYLLREGRAYRMSEDHTVVQEMLRRGLITAEEARSHRDRSVLARAMGTREHLEAGLSGEPVCIHPGDRLLLCSDGLHDLVEDDELIANTAEESAAVGAEKLLALALERGGHDNISLILLAAACPTTPKRPPRKTREHVTA